MSLGTRTLHSLWLLSHFFLHPFKPALATACPASSPGGAQQLLSLQELNPQGTLGWPRFRQDGKHVSGDPFAGDDEPWLLAVLAAPGKLVPG